ncbi:hypothetical protein G9F31_12580 [Acinetobacter sp. 187]|uniref:Uncharacterized protein n=1 Tax=Acinetobacter lanii TaxID=2715163 RepID=A0A6G8S1W8_9GAMM|nr:hypothetical protein [Acinetobacter lanii]NHC04589.1 hypothetical protein [Acinetobacter lanii]QIO08189.1 hypothetical protein G8D99_03530 [Acinetobacter lanii]
MRTQKMVSALILALTTVSFTASAAIINTVDFPSEFVQSKDKVASAPVEQVTASDVQK